MSDGLMIILVIVVWLFVLAPLLLRGQRPINKTGEAFDDTRVVYEGGSGDIHARRQPRVRPEDVHTHDGEGAEEDYELVEADAEDLLIEESAAASPESEEPAGAEHAEADLEGEKPSRSEEILDGEVIEPPVGALPPGGSASYAALEQADEVIRPVLAAEVYELNDSYTSAGDFLHPDALPVQVSRMEPAPEPEDIPEAEHPVLPEDEDDFLLDEVEEIDLTAEDLAFAKRRAGRGGWDPESDRRYSVDRYQRRRRTLSGLFVVVALALGAGFILGGWAWLGVPLAGILMVFYLVALRKQVSEEKALRARRIRHLRRARLGVRRAEDAEGGVPRELRRPGAVVVELDDGSPDFDYLAVTELHFDPPALHPVRGEDDLNGQRAG